MIKEGYKVVRHDGERLISCVIGWGAQIDYIVGEWVEPNEKCGPLCVFETMRHVEDWMGGVVDGRDIHPCEYKPAYEERVWDPTGIRCSQATLPKGTILASAVMLHERGE